MAKISINILPVLIGIALPIASYIVAFQNYHSECTEDALIPLPIWLIVQGSVDFAYAIIACCSLFCMFKYRNNSNAIIGVTAIMLGVSVVGVLWTIAWNIVGGVSLFRDSMSCLHGSASEQNHPIWAMTLAVLIWQWLSLLFNGGTINNQRKTIANGGDDTV
jgi:hypothetical protein